jgi:site-specific DNA-methyltransferase (adenine-specific)
MMKHNYNPDVLNCLANLSSDEIFTSPELVNQILDLLPQELFSNRDVTFLDPVTKTGVFLREIAKRLMEGLEIEFSDEQERINHIFKNQIFGIAITELTSLIARRSVYCSKVANGKYSICNEFTTEQGNIIFDRVKHEWHANKCVFCGANTSYSKGEERETHAYKFIHTNNPKELFNMKFDVIIGNPPYQLSDGGAQASAIPIYHKFIQQAKKLNPRYLTMITPSRWFSGGRGLDKFREEMLVDDRLRIIHDHINAGDCFPGVEIKGGVNYFLWDRDNRGNCEINTYEDNKLISKEKRPLLEKNIDIFIRYNQAIPIFKKIRSFKEKTFNEIMSSQKPFGLRTFFVGENEIKAGFIKIYRNKGIGYAKWGEVDSNQDLIATHKIIIPRAIGSGESKSDLIKPIYSEPGSACSETYIVVGPFPSEKEVKNAMSYIKTKFFHFMVTLKKNTMMAPKAVYEFAPIQDFSESWSDKKLYKKYNLNEDEIVFIESMIRPMELDNE